MQKNLHLVHSRDGRVLKEPTTLAGDMETIVKALQADPRRHLVLHFHGGLVPAEDGFESAGELYKTYSPSAHEGGYPVFFVWESGPWETIRNNFAEIGKEPAVERLTTALQRYVGRFFLRDAYNVFDAVGTAREVANPLDEVPPANVLVDAAAAQSQVDETQIKAKIENDTALKAALAGIPGAPDALSTDTMKSLPVKRDNKAALALDHCFRAERPQTYEKIQLDAWTLFQVARFLARVARAVLARFSSGRDHGWHATCAEEIVRAIEIGGSASSEWGRALQWRRMKADTADAFKREPGRAGHDMLGHLAAAYKNGLRLDRLTLVGHSTGAIYIKHWLENSEVLDDWKRPDGSPLKQDVVFLAPAITFDAFAQLIETHAHRIGRFRLFGMEDRHELIDQVWGDDDELAKTDGKDWKRFVYPASLLYLVSGILETAVDSTGKEVEAPDTPLLGMHRYWQNTGVYTPTAFPAIKKVKAWMTESGHAAVWSQTVDGADGFRCMSVDHGGFDDEKHILHSLQHIVSKGF